MADFGIVVGEDYFRIRNGLCPKTAELLRRKQNCKPILLGATRFVTQIGKGIDTQIRSLSGDLVLLTVTVKENSGLTVKTDASLRSVLAIKA